MAIYIESVIVGEFQVNCFILWAREPHAIVIDPGADTSEIVRVLNDKGLKPDIYLLTHGHCDHTSALADICQIMPAPVAVHADDLKWLFNESNQMPPFYQIPKRPAQEILSLKDMDERCDAGMKYRVIHTPGHTPGSICFHFYEDNMLITGDTLFEGTVGRTDLPGGDPRKMRSSLAKIAKLADNTDIYPGHGAGSDILTEKKTNYFMQSAAYIK